MKDDPFIGSRSSEPLLQALENDVVDEGGEYLFSAMEPFG